MNDPRSEPGARVEACAWPLDQRDRLTARLAAAAGLARLGPARRFELLHADVTPAPSRRARALVPAVLRVGPGAGVLIGVVAFSGEAVRLLTPDGRVVSRPAAALGAWLRSVPEAEGRPAFEAAVARAGVEGARARAVADALCVAALGAERIAEGVQLRPAQASLWRALGSGGGALRLAAAVGAYLLQLALLAGLWWIVGAKAVAAAGRPGGWAFVAIIAALVASRLAASWTAGRFAVDVGEALRERLLDGVLALDTESLRAEGIGQLLGRVVEAEQLESLALGGGLVAAAGAFELLTGVIVLAVGIGSGQELVFLAAWLVVAVVLGARAQAALRRWSELRLALTHDLVERMAGQRTLVAQQPPELRHREEDAALDRYEHAGRMLDGRIALLASFVPRGWLVGGVALLAPSLSAVATRPGAFAASLGGVLFVYGALRKLAQSFAALGGAAIAWRQIAPLFRASSSEPSDGFRISREEPTPGADTGGNSGDALVVARGLAFRYPGRAEPVLSGCAFEVRRGDRILLEGASGSGKSTLGTLLAGLRRPDEGRLFLDGIEQEALGLAGWRARIGSAPQFHENHVFSHTLLFNVLLGRAWPPRREDVVEAEAVLRELDLGPLLARMPSGLEQLVGESGWQLSHGERSRLYIARSLLQPLDARVLDESFAALDPETLERALACVRRRAETLIVIAHP